MGNTTALSVVYNFRKNPYSGKSCIKISYTPNKFIDIYNRWVGVYWLNPALNWGFVPDAGYDLTGASKVIFYAKGEKGDELIYFEIGGINGQYPDSCKTGKVKVELTTEWKKYEIVLRDSLDLSYVIGGFCFVIDETLNHDGAIFYLDDIYYYSGKK